MYFTLRYLGGLPGEENVLAPSLANEESCDKTTSALDEYFILLL